MTKCTRKSEIGFFKAFIVELVYLEDRRQAILEVATTANITISYQVKPRNRARRPLKPPEKRFALSSKSKQSKVAPTGKRAIGTRVSVEFYNDPSNSTTTWYTGAVIRYNR